MYIYKSIIDGLKILGFEKDTIKKISKEKNLEEIFLSTLFLNYLIIFIVYIIGLLLGGYSIENRSINMSILYGLLMIYPFTFNIIVYIIYGFFGLMAELINKKTKVKPLIAVGFHTAIVYTIILYLIGLLSTFSLDLGFLLFGLFFLWFIYTMFLSISTIYDYSLGQSLIVLILPFLLLGLGILIIQITYPRIFEIGIKSLFN